MKKFKIPSMPPTTSKSIRFPNDMIEEVEGWIRGRDCTFSAFVVEAVRVALDNLAEEAGTDGPEEPEEPPSGQTPPDP